MYHIILTFKHVENHVIGAFSFHVFRSGQGSFGDSLFLHWKDYYERQPDKSHLRKKSHNPTA